MTGGRPDPAALLARLEALAAEPGAPEKARRGASALAGRLRTPARIGLFGRPGGGKRWLLDRLAGGGVVDPGTDWPVVELSGGPVAQVRVTGADGAEQVRDGPLTPDCAGPEVVFLAAACPGPALRDRQLLLVTCAEDPADLAAGLAWAAPRTDIALWLARGWSGAEAAAWALAPEGFAAHTVLVVTDGPAPPAPAGFDAAFAVRLGAPGATVPLCAHLDALVAEAADQNVHLARLFLARHGRAEPAPLAVVQGVSSGPTATPEAREGLERMFQRLRQGAARLRAGLPDGPLSDTTAADVLCRIEELLTGLADTAMGAPELTGTWPALCATFAEARDLALLLRMEGGADQATDGAWLLAQVRQEIEDHLLAA